MTAESAPSGGVNTTRTASIERAIGPAALGSDDARFVRLKELRRDVVRALGTMFFQHLPDELLRRLIASPPKTVLELRDDFEVHNKIIENFGKRILDVVSASASQEMKQAQLPHVSQKMANVGHPAIPNYFSGAGKASEHTTSSKSKRERTSRAKVAASQEIAGGKAGTVYGPGVEARFERLRTLRLDLARARGWRAFRVLHDATLLEVARVLPRTIGDLVKIKGIGKKKAEDFGKELLAELAKE